MVDLLTNLITAFTLGLLTPLTAVCVLPLYPGFLAYLASQASQDKKNAKKNLFQFGIIISLGVITFMFLLGLIFTTILETSLTEVIGAISPFAFGLLAIISLLLIFNVDFTKYIPQARAPLTKNPKKTAFLYGLFFGAIISPCNPLFIAALFTTSLATMNFAVNILNFLMFGLGISAPLLLFSLISLNKSQAIISVLAKYKKRINQTSGVIMLVVSVYYLVFVFHILG
ncbi:MAG: cytochrome C biogenesis protein [Candidatus Diapherotrites archaeon]|nr:cytochrome C biogenesis protein [Candidatus Diapherotrites archaeon]